MKKMKKQSPIATKKQTYSHEHGLRRRWKKLWVRIIAWAVAAFLLVAGVVWWWYGNSLQAVDSDSNQKIQLTIQRGSTAEEIIDLLGTNNLIRSSKAFRWYLIREDIFDRMQAGTYLFSPAETAETIAQKLFTGDVIAQQLTIVSGERVDQIKARFVEAGYTVEEVDAAFELIYKSSVLADKPAGQNLEGYIFPDTYQFNPGTDISTVITQTFTNFEAKLTSGIIAGLKKQGMDLHQAFTLAAIVQKESSDPQLQKQIAQVFHKRLADGIKLESDPTFKYAAAVRGVPDSLSIDSLYNTYLHAGLPPGPISNFELSALEAVAYPAEGDFLFFVAGTDGVTRFSRTFAEHNALIAEHGVSGVE